MKLCTIQCVAARHVQMPGRRGRDEREDVSANGVDGAVVSRTENLITARARPAVQADWSTPGIGWALARSVGIHAGFDALGGVGDFRRSRYLDRGREYV